MTGLPTAFARALGQLADPAILRVLFKSVLVTLVLFVALGMGLWFALDQAIARIAQGYSAEIAALVSALLVIVGGWLLFRIVALAVVQFFADEIVMAVERKHYPDALATARDLPFRESLRESAKGLGRSLAVNAIALPVALVLLVTGIGTVLLFWVVNAWLLGRELQDIAWLRHREGAGGAQPLGGPTRFLLGGAVAALFAIPFFNLLAPVIGAAAATHLVHDRKETHADAL